MAIQISLLECAVPSFIIGYEMLGVSGFSKYDTITLKVRIVWNAGNWANLRIIYNNIIYLNFTKVVLSRAGNACSDNICVHSACILKEEFFP